MVKTTLVRFIGAVWLRSIYGIVILATVSIVPSISAATLTTLAGSGEAGLRDGIASQAQFLLPSAVAYDTHGNLYIADAAGQRIRVLGNDGFVRTLAGGGVIDASGLNVKGGFRDGPAMQSRFHHPSGLAIAPNDDVFVADTANHAIRVISRGVVSTFAGHPDTMGGADGALAAATFAYPHSIAFDTNGDIFVADYGNGLRKISKGQVTTVHTDFVEKRVTGVSIVGSAHGKRTLFVADLTGLSEIDLPSEHLIKFRVDNADTQGYLQFGPPYAVAGYGSDSVVFTDLRNDEVKALSGNNLQFITSPNRDDIVLGAQDDRQAFQAAVHGPLGVAVRSDRRVVIADGGHRVIKLAAAPATTGILPDEFSDSLFPSNAYRIALLSNSPAYWSQTDDNSVAHYVSESLNVTHALPGKSTKAIFFRNTFPGLALALTRGLLGKGLVDCVVLVVNSDFFSAYNKGTPPESLVAYSEIAANPALARAYSEQLTGELKETYRQLKANNVHLVLVAMPFPWDLGPSTDLFATEDLHNLEREKWLEPPYYGGPPMEGHARISDYTAVEHSLVNTLRASGAPVLDLWPIFRAVERKTPGILFPTEDLHFSPAGRKVVGLAIARELQALKPWSTP